MSASVSAALTSRKHFVSPVTPQHMQWTTTFGWASSLVRKPGLDLSGDMKRMLSSMRVREQSSWELMRSSRPSVLGRSNETARPPGAMCLKPLL